MQAGFDGYLANDPIMPQGFAVLLGKQHGTVPVAQTQAPGANPNPVIKKPKSQHDTTREGNELVRKPTDRQIASLIKNKAALQAAAPSYKMQYGSARVNISESGIVDQLLQREGSTFEFGSIRLSARETQVQTVDGDFMGIIQRMQKAGILEVDCG